MKKKLMEKAFELACKELSDDSECPKYCYDFEVFNGCGLMCPSRDEKIHLCWMEYFEEKAKEEEGIENERT